MVTVVLLGFAGCAGSPPAGSPEGTDIVHDPFPAEESAIRAEMLALDDVANRQVWDALRSAHLEGPKFTGIGRGLERQNFEEMIADEIAALSVLQNFAIDFRELKIDVFGEVAVATSFPLYTWTDANDEEVELELRSTMVWVKTADGWKIAHEHNSSPAPGA
jgi:hypothetical protein